MDHRVIIMHNLTLPEIDLVMRAVRRELDTSKDTVFAKTTENSLKMNLNELIDDMCEDHEYLKKNPPQGVTASKSTVPAQEHDREDPSDA